MGGRARKIQVLIFFVPILRAEITNLPEIMTQPECRALFEIEEFLPDFGLVNDLEFDVFLDVIRAHLFGETFEYPAPPNPAESARRDVQQRRERKAAGYVFAIWELVIFSLARGQSG
jgi:hypothetical protein